MNTRKPDLGSSRSSVFGASRSGSAHPHRVAAGDSIEELSRQIAHLYQAGNLDAAEALCNRVLKRQPRHFESLHALGAIHSKRGQFEDAERLIGTALTINDRSPLAWNGYGSALRGLKRFDEALESYRRAIALDPAFAQAFYNLAGVMNDLGRPEEALAGYDRAIALNPNYGRAHYNRGGVLRALSRFEEALASYDRVIALTPGDANAFFSRGGVLRTQGRLAEALGSYDKVVALEPSYADAFNARGIVLHELGRLEEALASFDRAVSLDPDHAEALSLGVAVAGLLCEWKDSRRRLEEMRRLLRSNKPIVPFHFLHVLDSPAEQLRCARTFSRANHEHRSRPIKRAVRPRSSKIRLGYMCGEFREHVTSHFTLGLFENHDRRDFELFAIAIGADDQSVTRRRLHSAFDVWLDAEGKSDLASAEQIAACAIDILIDLNGYTGVNRTGVFSLRPSPVQVNYFGYPGTMGSRYFDYIIADKMIIPEDARGNYSEEVVYLPDSYFVGESDRAVMRPTTSRAAHNLPENGFVFCGFNNPCKITPEMFDVWARLLKAIPGGVLWLNPGNPTAVRNLVSEMDSRGVAGERLVFAPPLPSIEEHLARLSLADLFLDTHPYNAHATAYDALFAGVPVVTRTGHSFASRVAASLLRAARMPEMITNCIEDYEALALKLVREPAMLQRVRDKLAREHGTAPLFDTRRSTRHLEAAYRIMSERNQRGMSPVSFAVTPIDGPQNMASP